LKIVFDHNSAADLADFSDILRTEAVSRRISAMGLQIRRSTERIFGERRLSYRLCPIHLLWEQYDDKSSDELQNGCVPIHIHCGAPF